MRTIFNPNSIWAKKNTFQIRKVGTLGDDSSNEKRHYHPFLQAFWLWVEETDAKACPEYHSEQVRSK